MLKTIRELHPNFKDATKDLLSQQSSKNKQDEVIEAMANLIATSNQTDAIFAMLQICMNKSEKTIALFKRSLDACCM